MLTFETFFKTICESSLLDGVKQKPYMNKNVLVEPCFYMKLIQLVLPSFNYNYDSQDSMAATLREFKSGKMKKSKFYPLGEAGYRNSFFSYARDNYQELLNKMIDISDIYWTDKNQHLKEQTCRMLLSIIETDDMNGNTKFLKCTKNEILSASKGSFEFEAFLLETWSYIVAHHDAVDQSSEDTLDVARKSKIDIRVYKSIKKDKTAQIENESIPNNECELITGDRSFQDNGTQTFIQPEKQAFSIQSIFVNNNCTNVKQTYVAGDARIDNGKAGDDNDGK